MESGKAVDAKPPSAFWRGVVALNLLVGFYLLTLGLALTLIVFGAGFVWLGWTHPPAGSSHSPQGLLIVLAVTWIPAFVLLRAMVVRVKPGPLIGARVERADVPALFVMLDELAAAAGTRPPDEVYIVPVARVGVTEVGGFLGFGSRRRLMLGAPMVAACDVAELRAILAHELGHYLGGDTRFAGVTTYTHALFSSLFFAAAAQREDGYAYVAAGRSTARALVRFIGVRYARFYAWATRATDRRLEHAADALAATLVGRDAAMRGLEKVHLTVPIYAAYWEYTLGCINRYQAVPADVLAGFALFRKRFDERGMSAKVEAAARSAKTDPLDTHPALNDRLDFLMAFPPAETEDRRPATDLFDHALLERFMQVGVQGFLLQPHAVRRVPWADFPTHAIAPSFQRRAGELTFKLGRPDVAATFALFVEELARGNAPALVTHVVPPLGGLAPFDRNRIALPLAEEMLGELFVGALLERGGVIRLELGESSFFVDYGGLSIQPLVVAAAAKEASSALEHLREWSTRLNAPRS